MEFPARVYLSIWAITGFIFLHLGFNALDGTGLSLSVHPLIMPFFKHSLAISVCHSSNYALIFHQHMKLTICQRYFCVVIGTVSCLVIHTLLVNRMWVFLFLPYLCLTMLRNFLPWLTTFLDKYAADLTKFVFINDHKPGSRICSTIHMALATSLFLVSGKNTEFYPILALFISFLTSYYWAELSWLKPYTRVFRNSLFTNKDFMKLLDYDELLEDRIHVENFQTVLAFERYKRLLADEEVLADERIQRLATDERFYHLIPTTARRDKGHQELLRVAAKLKENFVALKDRAMGKWIEFAIGMVGMVLFQNFFQLTSFYHAVAFLYMVVAWVANIALVGGGSSGDLGVFNFLLGNVVMGCTVSRFGLRGITWIVYGILCPCLVCDSNWSL